jgi:hypothetical protein
MVTFIWMDVNSVPESMPGGSSDRGSILNCILLVLSSVPVCQYAYIPNSVLEPRIARAKGCKYLTSGRFCIFVAVVYQVLFLVCQVLARNTKKWLYFENGHQIPAYFQQAVRGAAMTVPPKQLQ